MNIIFALEIKAGTTHAAKLAVLKSLTESAGYSVLPLLVSATDTPEQTRIRINAIDPGAKAYVWAFGPMQKPWCGPQAPDGHDQAPWASLLPWQTVASSPMAGDWANVWIAGGTPAMGWGPFYVAANPMGDLWRPGIGATDASGYTGVDADAQLDIQLDLIIAHLRGQSAYLQEAFICDHLEYPGSPVHNLGNSLAAQLTAAGWDWERNDTVDHDPQDLPAGSPSASAYFDELLGKQYGVLLYDSGGRNFSSFFYVGTTEGVERAKPRAALVMNMASTIGQVWEPEDIVRAFNFYALGSVWIGRVMPDVSLWLTGNETTGDMVRRHSQRLNATYVVLMGFPLVRWNPSPAPPTTTGATLLSNDQIAAINASVDTKIAALHDQLQADYTAKIAAAVLAIQTSQGQTGTPTGTVPPTGTSGTPATGTGTVPTVTVPSFGVPVLAAKSFQYNPAGSGWVFSAQSGLCADGSAWGNPAAGGQCAFIQGQGQISGTLNGLTVGQARTLNFVLAQRTAWMKAGPQTLNVLIDGKQIGTVTETTGNWQTVKVPFTPSAPSHNISLVGTANGDSSMFVQSVTVVTAG